MRDFDFKSSEEGMAVSFEDFELSNEDKEVFARHFSDEKPEKKDFEREVLKKGRIVKINNDFAMVDVGDKAEKRLPIDEIRDEDGNLLFKENDEIDLLVGRGVSFKRAQRQLKTKADIEALKSAYSENLKDKVIEVEVISKSKNGFGVKWADSATGRDIECFLPLRESALKHDAKPKPFKVCISKVNDNGVFVSRKRYFDISAKNKKERIEELLKKDSPLKGEVVNITAFGIFVDIDGIEGMVHSSELNHKNFANPASLYKVGDIVEVAILKYDEEKSKLSLSIKALSKDPWEDIAEQLQVGYTIKAIVSSIKDYGAFIDAGNDIEGFLHITEISWEKNIKHPKDYLKIGQEIDVEIIELNPKEKRLRVSLKKLTDKPFVQFAKKHKEGEKIKGTIATITDFGAFVRFGNVDGLLHNEDLSWDKQQKCKSALKVGDEIEVKITKIDKDKEKISLSRKALLESPTQEFTKTHKIGDAVSGNVIEIKDFGVFVKISDNIDALIKTEDLSPLKKDELKNGDSIEAAIVYIDSQSNKIRLSVKKLARQKEQDELKNYTNDEKMTLGDAIKDKLK